jgi:hypothetical protein
MLQLLVTADVAPSSVIVIALIMETIVPPKCQFLQEPHGITSQKTAFFIVTAVNTSNLTQPLNITTCIANFFKF